MSESKEKGKKNVTKKVETRYKSGGRKTKTHVTLHVLVTRHVFKKNREIFFGHTSQNFELCGKRSIHMYYTHHSMVKI